MAQVTIDMCDHIIRAADQGERFPLTVNELRQLAYIARPAIEAHNLLLHSEMDRLMTEQEAGLERQQAATGLVGRLTP